jgi:NAD(P)-dependent dehydrogenase (short-subunit alcohol dehydrogenase family)
MPTTTSRPQFSDIRVAVVTGGGHGIGRALCRQLKAIADTVVVVDLEGDAAKIVAEEIGGVAFAVDVADERQIVSMIEKIETELGPIDLFVSNAGVGFGDGEAGAAAKDGRLRKTDDRWEACWQINVMAHVHAARAMIPRMIGRGGGYLINTASAAGLLSQIGDAAYSASKHAAVAFAESLAISHANDGIQVSVLCPQAVATRMIGIPDDSESLDGGFGGNDVDGILRPEEVAKIVLSAAAEGRFMILPHPQVATYFQRKASDYDRWIAGMQRFRDKLLAAEKPKES